MKIPKANHSRLIDPDSLFLMGIILLHLVQCMLASMKVVQQRVHIAFCFLICLEFWIYLIAQNKRDLVTKNNEILPAQKFFIRREVFRKNEGVP